MRLQETVASWPRAESAWRLAYHVREDTLMRTGRDAHRRGATWFRVTAAASTAAALGVLGLAGTASAATGSATKAAAPVTSAKTATLVADSSSTCQLGNDVKHVVQLTFDNVHFFRDNPNVPSDLEL